MGGVRTTIGALGVGLVLGGALAGSWAFADPAAAGERIACRSFPYDPHRGEVDTREPSSPLGRWVGEREDQGWRVASVTPQVVVKATGLQDGWAHVCLVPVR